MSHSHFDQPIREWSARKHAILEDYLPTFCKALSRRVRGVPIYYIDGYAGAGVYRDINDPHDLGTPGSPVLAAQRTEQMPYDIRCINVEEDSAAFATLKKETANFSHVTNIHSDFNEALDDILKQVRYSPAFFFLDPFGTKDLPMEGLIDNIAYRSKQTDILLRYATETVRRLVGAYEKDHLRRLAHEQNLDRWFRGEKWREIIQNNGAGPHRDAELLQYYNRQLISISGGRLKFAADYPIRTIDGQIKYHLVFTSGDPLGMKLMSDILYKAETQYVADQERYQQQRKDACPVVQHSLFEEPTPDPGEKQMKRLDMIKATILRIGNDVRQEWEFYDLCCEIVIHHGWFARLSEKDIRAACKALHTLSQVEHLTEGNAWKKGTHLYIRAKP